MPSSPTVVADTLRESDRAAWQEYVHLERDGVRREAVQALEAFVGRLSQYSDAELTAFSVALTSWVQRAEGSGFPIRYPLWDRIVLPVLLTRYDARAEGSARTMLHFKHQFHGGKHCDALIGDRDLRSIALLARALELEPDARDLQLMDLENLEWWLDFAIHEVPWCVLYGDVSATREECEELLRSAEDYAARAQRLGVFEEHREQWDEWRYYIRAYREYLGSGAASFEAFLDALPPRGE